MKSDLGDTISCNKIDFEMYEGSSKFLNIGTK